MTSSPTHHGKLRDHSRAGNIVPLILGIAEAGAWLLAFFGPFPPHPWIFLLLAAIALVAAAAAITLALVNVWHRHGPIWLGFVSVTIAGLPVLIVGAVTIMPNLTLG